MKNNMIKIHKNSLAENTILLYLIVFSNQFINLIMIPYQTRVLGSVTYGKIGFAVSVMAYIQIILDFGFTLSATENVAQNRDNTHRLGQILSSVIVVKCLLTVMLSGAFLILVYIIPHFRNEYKLFILYYIAYIINAFLPDFIYRGIEHMRWITIRTLLVRVLFVLLMFQCVKKSEDYLMIPFLIIIGNAIAVLLSYIDLKRRWGIMFARISWKNIENEAAKTVPFFISRFSSCFYQALNTIILGIKFVGTPVVGYYVAADKLVSLAKTCSSPIADSLYPYMIRKKDYGLVKKILGICMPIIVGGAIFLFICAEPFCVIVFGKEYSEAASVLRIFIPIMIVILPTYILAFPVMVPLGLSEYANRSNVIGAVIQLAILLILLALGRVTITTLAIASCISEVSVFLYRLGIIFYKRKRI